ncbi:sulfotransferase family protein [Tropicibacter naphthalenivorans]|nr:sulfotransferase [Tropicibacter naphthalenivorans]
MKRIFILGLQRSGTTWTANMLAALPSVAAIQAGDHEGVHESIFFSHFAKAFGDWDDLPARRRFIEAFKQSDYFQLSGLEPELLDEFAETKSSPAEVFLSMMDLYAEVNGADAWIEKSPHHTFCAEEIAEAAPDAQFLIVQRRVPDLVRSRLFSFGRQLRWPPMRWLDVARGAIAAKHAEREMLEFAADNPQAMVVRYEDLLHDDDMVLREAIIDFLGLDAYPDDMISQYEANSSFAGGPRKSLGPVSKLVLAVAAFVGGLLPMSLLRRIRDARNEKRGIDWPDWAWKRSKFDPHHIEADSPQIILD